MHVLVRFLDLTARMAEIPRSGAFHVPKFLHAHDENELYGFFHFFFKIYHLYVLVSHLISCEFRETSFFVVKSCLLLEQPFDILIQA